MKNLIKGNSILLFLGILFMTLTIGMTIEAQTGGNFDLGWFTIDGGGTRSSGGDFALNGTTGQTDTGSLTGGSFSLAGGFWKGASTIPRSAEAYLPIVLNDYPPRPDLVIDNILASNGNLGVVIRNQGSVAVTDDFWVEQVGIYCEFSFSPGHHGLYFRCSHYHRV